MAALALGELPSALDRRWLSQRALRVLRVHLVV